MYRQCRLFDVLGTIWVGEGPRESDCCMLLLFADGYPLKNVIEVGGWGM